MNRIRLLPEHVANQIAAGEVVERPASVVKELVENSLDAQASRLVVEVQSGGRSLIRVTDDGIGMSRDDALLCLERHATSKISSLQDLQAISTMGFRGEAMPSLASVSRFTLTTREREDTTGLATQVNMAGGKMIDVKTAGAPTGTCVEIRQLFYNVPARRKFLRSDDTERAHVQHYLTLAALAHPAVAMTFIHDQRVVWQLPAVLKANQPNWPLTALRERWRSLAGGETDLVAVQQEWWLDSDDEAEGEPESGRILRVWGWIGAPGASRATRESQHLFVNRRPIENRGLNHALLEGYHTALMRGRFPICCLFIEIDPSEVDVNIHPAKREVKFRREREVREKVAESIRRALIAHHQSSLPVKSPVPASPSNQASPAGAEFDLPQLRFPEKAPWPASAPVPPSTSSSTVLSPGPVSGQDQKPSPAPMPSSAGPTVEPAPPQPPIPAESPSSESPAPRAETVPLLAVPLRVVGVIGKLYVVLESDRGMVLLDQHAAHERVLYEQLLRQLDAGDAPSQKLLLGETLELPPRDAAFLREHLPILSRLGVGLSEFGERTFLLDALPPYVRMPQGRRFVLELVDELRATGRLVNSWRLGEQAVAKSVCRHAVKAHDPLSQPELECLLEQLRQCAMPYTCPHGRPTLIEFNFRELDKRFGRTQ